MKTQYSILATLLVGLLSACGGSNNKTENKPDKPQLNTLTGKVIAGAGYVKNAKVCMDTNNNARCDDSEKSQTSGDKGEYQFTDLTNEALSNTPLIAEVGKEAINSDTNKPVHKAYVMTAPANSKVITPKTTLIQHYIEKKGVSSVEADRIIKNAMLLDAEVAATLKAEHENYQEATTSSNPKIKAMATHIKNMSLVMAHNMGVAYEGSKEMSDGATANNGHSMDHEHKLEPKQFMQLLAQKQIDTLPIISKVAHKHAASGVSQDTNLEHISPSLLTQTQLVTDGLEKQYKVLQAKKGKKPTELQTAMVDDALNEFTKDLSDLTSLATVRSLKLDGNDLNEEQQKADTKSLTLKYHPKPAKHSFEVLTDSGWQRPDNSYQVDPNVDKTRLDLLNTSIPSLTTTLTADEYNLKDIPADASFKGDPRMKAYLKIMPNAYNFRDGAKAMQVKSSSNNDVLMVDNKLNCEEPSTASIESCHVLVFSHSADGKVELFPTSLDIITSSTASDGDLTKLKGPVVANDGSRYIVAEIIQANEDTESGDVNYYLIQTVKDGTSSKQHSRLFSQGTWKETRVAGIPLVSLTVPDSVLAFDTTGNTKKEMFYTDKDGSVKQGHKGFSLPMKGVIVNDTANEDIINSLDFSQPATSAITDLTIFPSATLPHCSNGNTRSGQLSSKQDYDIAVTNCMRLSTTANALPAPEFTPSDTPMTSFNGQGDASNSINLTSQPSTEAPWKIGGWIKYKVPTPKPEPIRWKITEGRLIIEHLDSTTDKVLHRQTMTMLDRKGIVISVKIFHEDGTKTPLDGSKGVISDQLFVIADD